MLQGARDLTPSHIRKVVASDFARTLLGSISLTRLFYHVGVLHPQIRGIGLRWLRDRKVVELDRILLLEETLGERNSRGPALGPYVVQCVSPAKLQRDQLVYFATLSFPRVIGGAR